MAPSLFFFVFNYFITSLLGSLFHFFNCYVNSLFHGVIALLLCFAISFDRLVVLSFLFPSFGISFLLEYLERGCMTCNICGFVDLNHFGQGECYIWGMNFNKQTMTYILLWNTLILNHFNVACNHGFLKTRIYHIGYNHDLLLHGFFFFFWYLQKQSVDSSFQDDKCTIFIIANLISFWNKTKNIN